MTQMTRAQAHQCLVDAGFPADKIARTNTGLDVPVTQVMLGIGSAESDLVVNAVSGINGNGSRDYGWLQINSIHTKYDFDRIVSDPVYCAQAALDIWKPRPDFKAWYAYQLKDGSVGPYAARMAPGYGGPDLAVGVKMYVLVVKAWQSFLNSATPKPSTPLVVDGKYGAKSEAATVAWKKINHNDGSKAVTAGTWKKAGLI